MYYGSLRACTKPWLTRYVTELAGPRFTFLPPNVIDLLDVSRCEGLARIQSNVEAISSVVLVRYRRRNYNY